MLLFSFFLNIFLCQGYELSGEIALKNNHYYYYYYYTSVAVDAFVRNLRMDARQRSSK